MSDRNDEFRRQIGTLWRLAQSSIGTFRDVAQWSALAGRLRIDLALLQRERGQLYKRLGEQVAILLGDRSINVPGPVRETYDRIREIEARIRAGTVRLHDNAFGAPRGFEPEAAEDYDYGAMDGVDDREGVVLEDSTPSRLRRGKRQASSGSTRGKARAKKKTGQEE